MILVRMRGDEYVDIQILGIDENRQLPIQPIRQVRIRGRTAVREVQIDTNERTGVIFQNEPILPQIPDRERIRWWLVFSNTLHKVLAFHQLGNHILDGSSAVIGIVLAEYIR